MRTTGLDRDGFKIAPLTKDRWEDLEKLFGPHGAEGGCWCMFWRLRSKNFSANAGEKNKASLKVLASGERAPGLLAYKDGVAVGWCSLAPREDFQRLAHSRKYKPLDNQPVWSIICFFIAKPFRRQGLQRTLIAAACDWAGCQGAGILEAYPRDLGDPALNQTKLYGSDGYMGIASTFAQEGFIRVSADNAPGLIMRKILNQA